MASEYDTVTRLNLSMGFPSLAFTKRSVKLLASAAEALSETPEGLSGEALLYGDTQGCLSYREELAKFLTKQYQENVPIKSENLQVTAGATQGLHLSMSIFSGTGDVMFAEDPTYFVAVHMLTDDLNMKVIPVRTDDSGLVVSHLEEMVEKSVDTSTPLTTRRPFRAVVYTIPTFNNPSSISLSPDRCRQLVDVARKHNLLVVCDDVYNLLHYNSDTSPPPQRLLAYEREKYGTDQGNIISNGTFSKVMGPALRVGWIEAGKNIIDLIKNSHLAFSGGSFNHYGSQLITYLMREGHQERMIQDMITVQSARIQAVNKILDEELGSLVKYSTPEGGYFYWIRLPENICLDKLATQAAKYNVFFIPGPRCSPSGGYKNYIRISFSYYEQDQLVKAVKLLCKAVKEVLNK